MSRTRQNWLKSQADNFILKQELDASTTKIKQIEGIISEQAINSKKFNVLLKIGKIPDSNIIIDKIKTTDETLELEGVAESPDAVKLYLSRLKNLISPRVKLKNSTENDGQIIFSISINFS